MFHFKIRDLLWLTALVALVVGWWSNRNRLAGELEPSRTWQVVPQQPATASPPPSAAPVDEKQSGAD
jgi:hypothetical protein